MYRELLKENTMTTERLSEHLRKGIISGNQDKYYAENLTLEEQLEIRIYVADFMMANGKILPELQEPIDILKEKLSQNK
jgi:hypothetical protein